VRIGKDTSMHVLSEAKSSSFVDKIYRVNDRNESWFSLKTMNSRGYYKEIHEGRHFKNEWAVFEPENGKYYGQSLNKKGKISNFEGILEYPVSDILSALYKVRSSPLREGELIPMDVNTRKNWQMSVKVLRTEKISTVLGRKKCLVGEPMVGEEGIFVSKSGKRMFVWLTDDPERIPVLLRAEIFIGSVSAVLVRRTVIQ